MDEQLDSPEVKEWVEGVLSIKNKLNDNALSKVINFVGPMDKTKGSSIAG